MKTYSGKAKVKDDSRFIYKGLTLDIIGVYIEYKNGSGQGVFADGSREYRLSLEGTEWADRKNTVIHDKDLEIIELYQAIKLPFDKQETLELIEFTKANQDLSDAEILDTFIESNRKPSTPPVHDLSTLYSDEEWDEKHPIK